MAIPTFYLAAGTSYGGRQVKTPIAGAYRGAIVTIIRCNSKDLTSKKSIYRDGSNQQLADSPNPTSNYLLGDMQLSTFRGLESEVDSYLKSKTKAGASTRSQVSKSRSDQENCPSCC
jgi:hypothetical protein